MASTTHETPPQQLDDGTYRRIIVEVIVPALLARLLATRPATDHAAPIQPPRVELREAA